MPNVSPGPIIGTQWVPAKEGSKFKLDYVVTENATDPNVPVEAKLVAVQRLTGAGEDRVVERHAERRDPRRNGIHKRFGALVVLDDVNFRIATDEAVGIVGPNGAGKTTLLGVLAGAFRAERGHASRSAAPT